jgi:hypothetical protein
MIVLIIVVVVVLILALGPWAAYNALVKKRNRTREAWSEIDVELKRRHDLIPNLVSTVEGYASHERGTFEAVTGCVERQSCVAEYPSFLLAESLKVSFEWSGSIESHESGPAGGSSTPQATLDWMIVRI